MSKTYTPEEIRAFVTELGQSPLWETLATSIPPAILSDILGIFGFHAENVISACIAYAEESARDGERRNHAALSRAVPSVPSWEGGERVRHHGGVPRAHKGEGEAMALAAPFRAPSDLEGTAREDRAHRALIHAAREARKASRPASALATKLAARQGR